MNYYILAQHHCSHHLQCDHDHFDDDHLLDVQPAMNDHLLPHGDNLLAHL